MACGPVLWLGVPKPAQGASALSPEQPSCLEVVVEPAAGRGILKGSQSSILVDRAAFYGLSGTWCAIVQPPKSLIHIKNMMINS